MKKQFAVNMFSSRRKSIAFVLLFVLLLMIPDYFANAEFFDFEGGIRWVLNGVLYFESLLAGVAANIFLLAVDARAFGYIVGNNALYEIWKTTRDVVNLIFIFTLLFSAFATIFQIRAYRYDRILLNLVIMALLVNFSWPIARTIVDFFNSMMYFFIETVMSGQQIVNGFLSSSQLKDIFVPENAQIRELLLAIVVMFIFALTLLVLAILMLIRLIALPILIMFSPIGFAGLVAPLTQKYAKDWWDALFKYASYGPISVFLVLVSMKFLGVTHQLKSGVIGEFTNNLVAADAQGDVNLIVSIAYFAIPITLFWIAIQQSLKLSNELSKEATGNAVKFGKWVGQRSRAITTGAAIGSGMFIGAKMPAIARTHGRLRGLKERVWDDPRKRIKGVYGEQVDRGIASAKGREYSETDAIIRKAGSDDYKNIGESALRVMAEKGDHVAAFKLAQDGKVTDKAYQEFVNKFRGHDQEKTIMKAMNKHTVKNRLDLVVDYNIDFETREGRLKGLTGAALDAEKDKMRLEAVRGVKNWEDMDVKEVFKDAKLAAAMRSYTDALVVGTKAEQNVYDKITQQLGSNGVAQARSAASNHALA